MLPIDLIGIHPMLYFSYNSMVFVIHIDRRYIRVDSFFYFFRYSMVFVPFTGIDNHNNNVSFGAALLASETAETYKWLLRCFLKAFGKQPDVVVTDQDPAMKKAIEEVFTDSRHRLCMWHVMHKLSTKVCIYGVLYMVSYI